MTEKDGEPTGLQIYAMAIAITLGGAAMGLLWGWL